ncbi:hypothetical protein ES332_A01G050500v1 [Gossypium tomentosum]|uniref:Protein kinase domain-containing protein n=1 Tax=Gossypium tomentosum TaxID=34277 RepID=A0A5D2RLS1_GOSTO|nr:hypothetical protein ES332_A01G050500v1 [Gossypium tomentosum]
MPKLKAKLPLLGHLMPAFALFVILFPAVCFARHFDCGSTFCGNLNISFPFRLKNQPPQCGHYGFECENNNRTTLVGRGGKFSVQQFFYENYTIRMVDASLDTDDCNSLPLSSVYYYSYYHHSYFPYDYELLYFSLSSSSSSSNICYYDRGFVVSIIYVMNCTKPIKSSLYIEASRCTIKSNTSSSLLTSHFYFLNGNTYPFDINQACTIEAAVPIMIDNITGMSTLDIYKKLLEGFWVKWNRCYYQSCDYYKNKVSFEDVLPELIFAFRNYMDSFVHFLFHGSHVYYDRNDAPRIILLRRRYLSMDDTIEEFLQSQNNLLPIRYSFKEIKKMTKNFKDKLGEGGYGLVFKGKLHSGHYVAIKLLGKSKVNGQDFINEVASIGRIHHANVTELIGFCVEGSKQALKKMFDIVLGVAQEIHYLHQGCDMQILHFDIKPHNILLDENFIPKVFDFGLAKLYSVDDSIVSLTAARGTIGYIAPELVYKNLGGISYKADVYSFGLLLMEMAGRRKNVNAFADHTSQIYFPSWIYDRLDQGEDLELGDVSDDEKSMVKKMIITAFWFLKMLESDVELHQLPLKTSIKVDSCENSNDEPSTSLDTIIITSSNIA